MGMLRYIQRGGAKSFVIWMKRFRKRAPNHQERLKLDPSKLDCCLRDLDYHGWVLEELEPAAENFAHEVAVYKKHLANGDPTVVSVIPTPPVFDNIPEAVPPGVEGRLQEFIDEIKKSEGYSDEFVGMDLDIVIPVAAAVADAHPCPTGTLKGIHGPDGRMELELMFMKYGHDGVAIRCKTNGGEWESLGVDNRKPYIDDRPLQVPGVSEVREYQLRFWDKGKENGPWSPSLTITVTPTL